MAQQTEQNTAKEETDDKKSSSSSSLTGFVKNVASWTASTAKEASTAVSGAANTVGHNIVKPSVTQEEAQQRLKKQKEEKKQEEEDMKWFDDIVDGTESNRGGSQIVSTIWKEVTGENMMSRIMSTKQRGAAKIWGKLCHRCDISYPAKNKLKVIDMFDGNNIALVNEMKYAVRHAIAAYPPAFVVFLGLKTDVSYALKSTKKLLKSCFDISSEDIRIDNCTNNLIIANKTHEPSFYLCVDHKQKKIILSIRGSSSLSDALTDVNATSKKFQDGFVHEGIMASAKFVFDKATIELIKLCKQYKNYQALITGHSLGAGVAGLLGLMYNNHDIIHKQNNLRVFPFASPCIVSKEFIDAGYGKDYIVSVALSTDLVTRLSIESMKQQNIRLDLIEKYDQDTIKKCMTHLKDDKDPNKDKDAELLKCLKETVPQNPEQQLFPIGRVLWLVPKGVMDDDVERKRRCLMCLKDDSKSNDDKKFEMNSISAKSNKISDIFSATLENFTKGIEEFQQTMDQSVLNTGGSKYTKQYDGSNYILCDATKCRSIFQEMVLDLPESLYAHMPNRYMWACDGHLTRGDLNDE